MGKGYKYIKLTNFLINSNKNEVKMTINELNNIVELPDYSYKYKTTAFHNSSGHSLSYGWLNAGYESTFDITKDLITFTKIKEEKNDVIKKQKINKRKPGLSVSSMIRILELEQKYNKDLYKEPGYRTYLDFIFRSHMFYQNIIGYSKAAKKLYDSINCAYNIEDVTFTKQSKFDKGHKLFHIEHVNPVSMMLNQIFEQNMDVKTVLSDNKIVLITKEENKLLTEKGYKSIRPGGWEKSYKECGIEIIFV